MRKISYAEFKRGFVDIKNKIVNKKEPKYKIETRKSDIVITFSAVSECEIYAGYRQGKNILDEKFLSIEDFVIFWKEYWNKKEVKK